MTLMVARMRQYKVSRRQWLSSLLPSAGFALSIALSGCSSGPKGNDGKTRKEVVPADCTDLQGLTDDERNAREALGYEASASDPERRCAGCALYIPPKEGGCGGCMLFKGPVLAEGSCIQFQSRPA